MATQQRFEGNTLAEVLAKVQREVGPDAKIASAQRVRSGGAFGFFQRERYEVLVDIPDTPPEQFAAPPEEEEFTPASLLELAQQINAEERAAQPKVSTESDAFAEVLSRVAYQANLETLRHDDDDDETNPIIPDRPAFLDDLQRTKAAPIIDAPVASAFATASAAPAPVKPVEDTHDDIVADELDAAEPVATQPIVTPPVVTAPIAAEAAAEPFVAEVPVVAEAPVAEAPVAEPVVEHVAPETLEPAAAAAPTHHVDAVVEPVVSVEEPIDEPVEAVVEHLTPERLVPVPVSDGVVRVQTSATDVDIPVERTRITDHPLANLGLPATFIPPETDIVDLRESLTDALHRHLPRVPVIRPSRGSIIAVVGYRDEALRIAGDIAHEFGRPDEEIVVASQTMRGKNMDNVLRTIEGAEDAQRSWSRRTRPTIVAIEAYPGSRDVSWAELVLTALEPIATFGVIDATRKSEDVAAWADALGGIDCIALNNIDETVSPAEILRAGIPVERIDGRKATPEYWALLLTERLTA